MRECESSTDKPMSSSRFFQGTERVIVNLEPDALLKTSPKIQTGRSTPTAPRGAIRVARLYLESVTAQTGASPPRLLRQYQAVSQSENSMRKFLTASRRGRVLRASDIVPEDSHCAICIRWCLRFHKPLENGIMSAS